MKPVIAYVVARTPYSLRLRIIEATTIKASGRVYGRHADEHTNVSSRDVLAQYPTAHEAAAALARVSDVREAMRPRLEEARKWVEALEREQREKVSEALKPQ